MLQMLARCNLSLRCSNGIINQTRNIFATSVNRVKEIVATKEGKETTFEGVISESSRVNHLLKPRALLDNHGTDQPCSICRLNLELKHTDVLILSQFMRTDGCMLPRRITGLCRTQQKRVSKMVTMALKAGLMPNLAPANSKRDPALRDKFKKNHRYFDETTIRPPRILKYPTS